MNDISKYKKLSKIIGYVLCAVLPLYIYSLFVSLRIFTTSTGGFFNLVPAFNFFVFITLLIILSLFQIFFLKKVASSFGIYSSQKIIIIINIISYIVILAILSSILKFNSAMSLGNEVVNMPIFLLLPVIVLAIIFFFIIRNNTIVIKNNSLLLTAIIAFTICLIGIYGYYNWNYGGIMTVNEIKQYSLQIIKESDAAKTTKKIEGYIAETTVELQNENVDRTYKIFALQNIDKVTSVDFTEFYYFTNATEEKVILDEINAKNKELNLGPGAILYKRYETSNSELVHQDFEKNSTYPYVYWVGFNIGEGTDGNSFTQFDMTEKMLSIMNPIIKNVTIDGNISYEKLINIFRNNGYSIAQSPERYNNY